MTLPAFSNLDTIQRPSAGASLLTAWGDAVNDDVNFLAGETSWSAPSFTNGWGNFGTGYNNAAFKLIGNFVVCRGVISGGTVPAVAFTLPPGYRPPASCLFICGANGAVGIATVGATGALTVVSGSNVSFSLDQVEFSVI